MGCRRKLRLELQLKSRKERLRDCQLEHLQGNPWKEQQERQPWEVAERLEIPARRASYPKKGRPPMR